MESVNSYTPVDEGIVDPPNYWEALEILRRGLDSNPYTEDPYYDDFDNLPSFEEAYEDYVAEMNARTHFEDVRKQATRDREKDTIHREKRRKLRNAKLTKKANDNSEAHEKPERKRPSKKSGRRGAPGRDIVVF